MPRGNRSRINFLFPNRLSSDQAANLEMSISTEEIRNAVWACGENKSPGPDGFTFEFFRKFWGIIGPDFCLAVKWFFDHNSFSKGCNSAFIDLIPKVLDPKFVSDYRPISLIGCLYKCKHKKQQAMIFKVDFAKAYDSIRWDFLDDVLHSFGLGLKWHSWILGSLSSGRASILVNGSPTSEFQFHCGLKQGDPLAPYLFILVMESLHLSFSRVVDAGIFKGLKINNSTTVSHLFYADDAVFVGEWVEDKRKKSHLLGVGIPNDSIAIAASTLGCSVMKTPFKYLGVMVGGNMSNIKVWDDIIRKLNSRLSKWKVKSLSIGGRLMLLKSVLGSTPIYWMSLYKVPKSVLASMEAIRRKFFNGAQDNEKKVTWIKWSKVLSAKKQGGLGVSSFYALNRALLFKWVWRCISQDNSLWFRVISAIHGSKFQDLSSVSSSSWNAIVREVRVLKSRGVDLLSHCKKRVGNGMRTSFWCDVWIGDQQLSCLFPRIFALEEDKDCSVAAKLQGAFDLSFRRQVRGGVESQQLIQLQELISTSILTNTEDRWVWDLNGSGSFRVSDVRNLLDEFFLPKDEIATRWIKFIPIKVNVFAWKVSLDRLPTRLNLIHRGVHVPSLLCPICSVSSEDTSHLLFSCPMASDVARLVCRWWDLVWTPLGSYSDRLSWFKSIRLGSNLKAMLEGVFYISWWCIWNYRNQLLFAAHKPRKDVIFDDIVARSFTWCNARCIIRQETQNDYTSDQMVEWAEQEHFEYEETKTSHSISPISTMLSSTIETCLSYTHFYSPVTYYMAYEENETRQAIVLKLQREIQAEETLAHQLLCNLTRYTEEMHIRSLQITSNPENIRLTVLIKLQEALDEEAILEEQMLALMHRFANRFMDRRVEINNLMVLHDHPLIDYGKYALGCMTGADMKKCVELKGVRDKLLRSMEEKRQLITNYRDM
ncbi:RNA-directed DNA polymerase, eukaryota [Tanacetum coccineum]|uniref:RNA-directed DNA polymerase, eukaryota n=1 Tax=Tanacetum coccineum TaxID=301880 RepID=A0ABQ5FF02_9ASTR